MSTPTTQSGLGGALWISDYGEAAHEVLDGGIRLATYLANTGGSCGGTYYAPPTQFENPGDILDGSMGPVWIGVNPADNALGNAAPWWSADHPESEEFMGFFTDDVNGLREVPFSRQQYQRGGFPGGSVIGGARSIAREVTFTVTAKATTGRGLTYGTRWLGEQLLTLQRQCGSSSVVVRDRPVEVDGTVGVFNLYEAGTTTPPIWTTDPGDCTVASGTFTITCGDSCLYSAARPISSGTYFQKGGPDNGTVPSGWDICEVVMGPPPNTAAVTRTGDSPTSPTTTARIAGFIPAAGSLGQNGAFITLTNLHGTVGSGGIRISTYESAYGDTDGYTFLNTHPDEVPVSVIDVQSIDPGDAVTVDVLRRSIEAQQPDGSWASARGRLDLTAGVSPTWATARKTPQVVFVEPIRPWCAAPQPGVAVGIYYRHSEGCVS